MKNRNQPQSMISRIAGTHTPAAALTAPSPAESSIVPIDISQIEPYQHNPRLYDNPKYETIKESIRERGILQRLIVTKRPGSENFTLCQGGNTRLKCLRELYRETSDPKFGTAYCELREWRNETDIMVGHVVENELRANLNWHEKSRMAVTLYQMFAEHTTGELSVTEFERLSQSKGMTIRRNHMHLYRYTVEKLESVIPRQLQRGLARRPVERIMKTDRALRSIWISAQMPEKQFDDQFRETLARFDEHESFNAPSFLSYMAFDLSTILKVPRSYLETAVDEYIRLGDGLPVIDGMPREKEPDPAATRDDSAVVKQGSVDSPPPPETTVPPEPSIFENTAPPRSHRRPSGETDALDGERLVRRAPGKTEKLRTAIYRQANLLEIATGNRGCISPMQLGYGFIVLHLPRKSDWSKSGAVMRDQAWWLLNELSAVHEGLLAAPDLIRNYASAQRSPLAEWFESANFDDLAALAESHGVRTRSPLHSVGDLIRVIENRSLKIAMELMTAVHCLEQHYLQSDTEPWKTFDQQTNLHQS